MIVGETRTVRHTETGETAFLFDATPILDITLPDGTAGTSPTVTDSSPSVAVLVHTLSAAVPFPQAGAYLLRWSMDVGEQDPIVRIETYFATWTDVHGFLRARLNRTNTQLSDATIDREMAILVRILMNDYPCLGDYNSLLGLDRAFFDDALALMVAAGLRGGLGRLPTDGDLVKRREGDTEYTFADRGKGLGESQEMVWLTDAWAALRRIGCIADGLPDVRAGLRWALVGRRRAAERAGNIVSDTNPLLRYLIDEERRMIGSG